MSDIELKRTIAQLDKVYTDACMDKRVLEGRIEALIAHNAALVHDAKHRDVEAEELLQAAERDLDRQDVEIAALKATNELLVSKNAEAEEFYIAIRAQIEELSAANELVTREKDEAIKWLNETKSASYEQIAKLECENVELSDSLKFEKSSADELAEALDAADDESAELRARISELSSMLDYDRSVHVPVVRENIRLRDVIVHQAAQLAGCGE